MGAERYDFASLAPARLGRPGLNLLKFILPIFVILSTSVYLWTETTKTVPTYVKDYNKTIVVTGVEPDSAKAKFVHDFLNNEIDGPYNGEPLRQFCAGKKRKISQGLVIKCQSPIGGFGNIKNMVLNCLRFGIEAGAYAFVIPVITVRDKDNIIALQTDETRPFSYMFDLKHFIDAFTTYCPQIRLFNTEDELIDIHGGLPGIMPSIDHAVWEMPDMQHHHMADSVLLNEETYRKKFDDWLKNKHGSFSASKPVVVTIIGAPLLRWPINYDPPEFVATYGRLILARQDVRELAAAVLFSLSEKDSLNMDVSKPHIEKGKFYGVHLRTDIDALNVGWPGYDMQAENYLIGGRKSGLTSMYLASGNKTDSDRFLLATAQEGIIGSMKHELLARPGFERELERMNGLNWDQQGIIDYEVLLRCSDFSGVFESSFSWAVSNRRHLVLHGGKWEPITEGHTGAEERGPETFMDFYSTIYGPKDMLKLRWQFPLALWP